jgi:hypothetical protein
MDRTAHAGKQIVNALAGHGAPAASLRSAVTAVRDHAGVDSVGARRRIGDSVISRTRYPF